MEGAPPAPTGHILGFGWPGFLNVKNSSLFLVELLTSIYQTTDRVIVGLALHRRGERLAEFMAILILSTVALCVNMLLLPAAGVSALYEPAPELFGNYSAQGQMWPLALAFKIRLEQWNLVMDTQSSTIAKARISRRSQFLSSARQLLRLAS